MVTIINRTLMCFLQAHTEKKTVCVAKITSYTQYWAAGGRFHLIKLG